MYKYLLFDLDGTLVDTSDGILKSAQCGLREMGIDVPDISGLRHFIGPPLKDTFINMYHMSDLEAVKATAAFRRYYNQEGKFQCRLYDGIVDVLHKLKEAGYILFVATSKPTVFSKEILKFLNIECYFEGIAGSNLDNTRSQKVEIIQYILTEYGIKDKSQVVMIGDKSHDLIGAVQAGVSGIGVSFGFGTKEELNSVPHEMIVDSAEELFEYLEN